MSLIKQMLAQIYAVREDLGWYGREQPHKLEFLWRIRRVLLPLLWREFSFRLVLRVHRLSLDSYRTDLPDSVKQLRENVYRNLVRHAYLDRHDAPNAITCDEFRDKFRTKRNAEALRRVAAKDKTLFPNWSNWR